MQGIKFYILAVFVGVLFTMCAYAQDSAPVPPAQSGPLVPVVEQAAPPTWVQQLIVDGTKFPIIGPYVTKALLYAGVLSSILTAIVGCLLAIIQALSVVLSYTPLAGFAVTLQNFKDGKIMYYLKLLAMGIPATHPQNQAILNQAKLKTG